jgi:uncharacterized protein YhfF
MGDDRIADPSRLPAEFDGLPRWSFGDSPALADELGMLVVAGRKTATCSLLDGFAERWGSLPKVGQRDIVLDGRGKPLCVIETVEVEVRAAGEVDEAFAHDEGEDDRTLRSWRQAHERFFGRAGVALTDETKLVCERFKVVHRF